MYVKEKLIPKLGFVFESRDVIKLLGISPIYLNKFIERRLFGIRPSVRTGKGRGRRRLFNIGDVYAIATVWWLFQSGLRSKVISKVLRDVTGQKRADANLASGLLMVGLSKHLLMGGIRPRKMGRHVLVIECELGASKRSRAKNAGVLDMSSAQKLARERQDSSVQVIPTGKLFAALVKRLHGLKPES